MKTTTVLILVSLFSLPVISSECKYRQMTFGVYDKNVDEVSVGSVIQTSYSMSLSKERYTEVNRTVIARTSIPFNQARTRATATFPQNGSCENEHKLSFDEMNFKRTSTHSELRILHEYTNRSCGSVLGQKVRTNHYSQNTDIYLKLDLNKDDDMWLGYKINYDSDVYVTSGGWLKEANRIFSQVTSTNNFVDKIDSILSTTIEQNINNTISAISTINMSTINIRKKIKSQVKNASSPMDYIRLLEKNWRFDKSTFMFHINSNNDTRSKMSGKPNAVWACATLEEVCNSFNGRKWYDIGDLSFGFSCLLTKQPKFGFLEKLKAARERGQGQSRRD